MIKSPNSGSLFNRSVPVNNNWIKEQIKDSIKEFKSESGQGQNILSLLFYQRAITNYVKILTGRDIPVRFANEAMAQRQGEKEEIIISAMQGPESFDISVGAALHEASRLVLSDKKWLLPPSNKRGEYGHDLLTYITNTDFLNNLNSNVLNESYRFNSFLGSVLNWIEDRRVDTFIFKSSPGYKNYYHQLYLKYYLSKIIDKAIMANRIKDEDLTSYLFYITNFLNSKVRGDELKGLRDIKAILNPTTISALTSTEDSAKLALSVIQIVDSYLKLEEDYREELRRQEEERKRKEEEARQQAAADELKRQQQEELNNQENADSKKETSTDHSEETQEDDETDSNDSEDNSGSDGDEDNEENSEANDEGDSEDESDPDDSSESESSQQSGDDASDDAGDTSDEGDSTNDPTEADRDEDDDSNDREDGQDGGDKGTKPDSISDSDEGDQEDEESDQDDTDASRGAVSGDNESSSTMEGNDNENDGTEDSADPTDNESGNNGEAENGSEPGNTGTEQPEAGMDAVDGTQEPVEEWTAQDEKELGEALDKQLEFLSGEAVKKKAIGYYQAKALNALANANVDITALDSRTNIVNILVTPELIKSGAIDMAITYNPYEERQSKYYTNSSEAIAVTNGFAAGRRLANMMRLVNEDNTLIYNQQKRGQLDGRAVSGLGYGKENIYYRKEVVGYKKSKFHITVDGSGSMSGDKWNQTLQFIATIAQAFKIVGTIELTVSIRYSEVSHQMKQAKKDNFVNLIIYDSTKHTIATLKQILPCFCTTGNTPEGACYIGLLGSKYLPKQLSPQYNHYFITLTDGAPTYDRTDQEGGRSKYRYSHNFIEGTTIDIIHQQAYYKIKNTGYKTLAYFLFKGETVPEHYKKGFDAIYGSDGHMLSVTELTNLARALNEMLLDDKINK